MAMRVLPDEQLDQRLRTVFGPEFQRTPHRSLPALGEALRSIRVGQVLYVPE
jgi:hypothetical protein